ncbi:MAG: diguanylate cyclase [Candidatus Gastranaerophilales bacterium]|nr:diguanylate cyclase [Candidatus Gastranaerophilales bacterium]
MSFNFYKDFISKAKSFGNKIGELENTVQDEKFKFKEVFERNIILEKEISERTEELNQANKSLLTLQHIWSTMNSEEPLTGVLSTVIRGLVDGAGYIYSSVLQIYENNEKSELRIRALTENAYAIKVQEILGKIVLTYSINLENENNIFVQALKSRSIKSTKSYRQVYHGSDPKLTDEQIECLDALLAGRLITILPLIANDKPFGCLFVISIRNEISDTEKNFLNLFAGQTELAITIAGLFEKIRNQANTDGLTGLYNRRYFDQCLVSEADRSMRLRQPFTLIALDLDHLKQINDTHGHSTGDVAICHIGSVLKQNARSIDIPSRSGGEEFAIILPGIDIEGGMIAAERLRIAIEAGSIEGPGKVTASIGVATFLKHTESVGELLELVDQAMYKAKRNGRNQVQLATKEENIDWRQLAMETFAEIITKQRIPLAPAIANDLIKKFKTPPTSEDALTDFLYYITDSLSKTYQPLNKKGHTREKVEIATEIAEKLNLIQSEIDKLKMAVLLYDIGNLMMPENILLKPGKLTEKEKTKIQEHPIIAAREILKPILSANHIISVIEHHHENWDGTGYPSNLAGKDIPVASRIILIIDAYFALISDRPYRKSMTHKEAIKILKEGANTKWDSEILNLFIAAIEQKQKKPV